VALAQGCPVKVVTAAALGNKCDLCVMGSRGLSAVKRALVGSVSSRVASSCPCPVMVIKRPQNEVGAFLTVLPRRVFIRIDGSSQARDSFQWAMECLLSPEIDEVFLMSSSKRTQKRGLLGFGGGQRASQQELEDERELIQDMANRCEEDCIRKGLNATKMDVGSYEEMLRQAEECSCDLLVVGKDPRSHKEDAALYAAHHASFPVIVVGDTSELQHRVAMQASVCARPGTAPAPDRGLGGRRQAAVGRPTSGCQSRPAPANSFSKIMDDETDKKEVLATLGPRSSSLERLLGCLENTDDSLVACSRRAQLDAAHEEEQLRMQSRRPTAVPEDGVSMNETTQTHLEPGGGMRRVATKATFKASTMPGVEDALVKSRMDSREPWMQDRERGGQPAAMMAS